MTRSRIIGIVTGFFLLTLAVYGASLGNKFVAWDDNYLIFSNPIIKGLTWQHIVSAFTSFDPELYDPLTFIVYQLNYTVAGLSPFMFHATNLFLHFLNALGVCWVLYLVTKREWASIIAGLVFAVHPLNTEAVAWASALKDTLSTFFFLVSVIAYLHYRDYHKNRPHQYILSIVAFLLGLLSKVMVLSLPIVLILLDLSEKRPWNRKMILEKIPYFLLSGIFGCIALFGKSLVVTESTPMEKVLMAAKSTMFYIGKFIWPTHLSVLYPYSKPITISSPDFLLPVIGVLCLLGIVVAFWKKFRAVSIGILFYLITLFPTFVNFAKGGYVYVASDRYAYIPQIGLLLLIVSCAGMILDRSSRKRQLQQSMIGASVIVIAILSVLAGRQSLTWKNTETLFLQTLKYYPDALAGRLNLGYVYRESDMQDKALEQFQAVLLRDPKSADAYVNIGAVYEKQGKVNDAIDAYKKGMEANPKIRNSYFSLGLLYEKLDRTDEAFELYKKVADMSPGFSPVYVNLGSIYVEKNDLANAEASYKKAISINPYYSDAHFNLALVYGKQNKADEAEEEYETTLQLEGDKIDILKILVGLYAAQNKSAETIRTLKRMLVIDPNNAFAKTFLQTLNAKGF